VNSEQLSDNSEQVTDNRESQDALFASSSVHCYLLSVLFLFSSLFIFLFLSCSSQPKNAGDIYDMRIDAETQLEQGNTESDRGNYAEALVFFNQANRFAVLTDNSSILIRSGLSIGNALFALGNTEEAFEAWNKALKEAEFAVNSELAALSRVHIARGKMLTGDMSPSIRNEVNADLSRIKSRTYSAFAWTVVGLAVKELRNFTAAENAVRKALAIHEKDSNLELAANDWFMIASIRSLSGNSSGAITALETALRYDRRTENSWGLANDWLAIGDVRKKAGKPDAARTAYLRAAEIFRAMGNDEAAEKALAREE
jgi:tetratricopeptide (TPR) repeat protein